MISQRLSVVFENMVPTAEDGVQTFSRVVYHIITGFGITDFFGQCLPKQHRLIDIMDAFWPVPCCNTRSLSGNPFDVFYVGGLTFAANCPPYSV